MLGAHLGPGCRCYVEGIAVSLLAAAAWGVSPVLMRAAVVDSGLGVLGGLVTYVATAAVLLLTFAIPGPVASTLKMDRTGGWWFLFSAVNSFSANIFRFMALAIAPVTLVMPLLRVGAIFGLGFAFVLNRSLESFAPRVIAGILISIAGAVLLAV